MLSITVGDPMRNRVFVLKNNKSPGVADIFLYGGYQAVTDIVADWRMQDSDTNIAIHHARVHLWVRNSHQ